MTLTSRDVLDFLQTELAVAEAIEPDEALFSSGLLDSVAMMSLIGFVEEKARFEVRPGDVTLDNFDTASRIEAYVDAQR